MHLDTKIKQIMLRHAHHLSDVSAAQICFQKKERWYTALNHSLMTAWVKVKSFVNVFASTWQ